jgi:hypothetical protein
MILYHGTTYENAIGITSTMTFDISKTGENWGNTFGPGIYFTPNIETAKVYAGKTGVVLMCDIVANGYQLKRNYSVSNRNDRREIKRLLRENECIISKDMDEYIFTKVEFTK